jgi:F0F1-type ATP synthase membrane subunit a
MMLAVLTSVVQAYIFAILTAVYLSSAVRVGSEARSKSHA